jgi:hypothetical protein
MFKEETCDFNMSNNRCHMQRSPLAFLPGQHVRAMLGEDTCDFRILVTRRQMQRSVLHVVSDCHIRTLVGEEAYDFRRRQNDAMFNGDS